MYLQHFPSRTRPKDQWPYSRYPLINHTRIIRKPVSYDATRKRLSTYYSEKVGEDETTPNLEQWLEVHQSIRDAIIWESSSGTKSYSHWSSSQKQALESAFISARNRSSLTSIDPPPNIINPDDNEHATTVLAHANAWPLFLAHVAQSLAIEIGEWVNWSIVVSFSCGTDP